ncbi:hypothetical protein APHAL10511_002074 [Amanita phalloides]|nr:hypothetical protein APHAL10511_002074 [Amanita phalloides]
MFSNIHEMQPTDADLATRALTEEGAYRFPAFNAADAVTLGLSIRKRFRASQRHAKGKGMVISIQTIAGHTLFSCTVGDLGHVSGIGDVSLDSWTCLEGMITVVKRTGHSSYYVEKGMSAMGKTAKQMGIQGEYRVNGGAFPIWLENAPCCPIAIAACYSGSSHDDHYVLTTSRLQHYGYLTLPAAGIADRQGLPDKDAQGNGRSQYANANAKWSGRKVPIGPTMSDF